MADTSSQISILVAGATGILGQPITQALLSHPNLQVTILVRNPEKHKELVDQVTKSGGKVIQADLLKPETLNGVTKGIHTVISVVHGDAKTYIDGQEALLKDAILNGVKRFVPSEFGATEKVAVGESELIDWKFKFRQILKESKIDVLHVSNSPFAEWITLFAPNLGFYGEDPTQKFKLTPIKDIVRYTVAALADKNRIGNLRVPGIVTSLEEVATLYNKLQGSDVKPKRLGSIADLQKNVEEARANNDFRRAVQGSLQKLFFERKIQLVDSDAKEFPDFKLPSIEEFLKDHHEIKFD